MGMAFCRASACIRGGEKYPGITGTVTFTSCGKGTRVSARITGLPESETGFFGFHIHEGTDCRGQGFSNTGSHFDLRDAAHPMHSGDLPPLLSCGGEARMDVVTGRFQVHAVVGRTVVIHRLPDDLRSQPSGNAGEKIACGVIRNR